LRWRNTPPIDRRAAKRSGRIWASWHVNRLNTSYPRNQRHPPKSNRDSTMAGCRAESGSKLPALQVLRVFERGLIRRASVWTARSLLPLFDGREMCGKREQAARTPSASRIREGPDPSGQRYLNRLTKPSGTPPIHPTRRRSRARSSFWREKFLHNYHKAVDTMATVNINQRHPNEVPKAIYA
jgi:hypothetical protein